MKTVEELEWLDVGKVEAWRGYSEPEVLSSESREVESVEARSKLATEVSLPAVPLPHHSD